MLLLLVLLLVLAWWGRRGARRDAPPAAPPPTPEGREPMMRCPHCGVHVPQSQSWPGRGGAFCSAEHRAAHESGTP
ncbi:PP0621 family protein [Inhella crocodyli]|uniref:PP0621 family protein n=1 Tax=Inhella crocodyli TaxID=2499851 RepID=UPI0035C0DFCC